MFEYVLCGHPNYYIIIFWSKDLFSVFCFEWKSMWCFNSWLTSGSTFAVVTSFDAAFDFIGALIYFWTKYAYMRWCVSIVCLRYRYYIIRKEKRETSRNYLCFFRATACITLILFLLERSINGVFVGSPPYVLHKKSKCNRGIRCLLYYRSHVIK